MIKEGMSATQLRRKLFDVIRKFYLKRAKRNKNGRIYCPLKKQYYPEKEMQVCHFIDRLNSRLRYDPRNLLLASMDSNYYDSRIPVKGYKSKHHMDYEHHIGKELADELRKESQLPQLTLTREILQYYYDYYTENLSFEEE